MSEFTRLKPVNRHILVVPHPNKDEEQDTGVLLPEGYAPKRDKYSLATVVDVAPDCAKHFHNLRPTMTSDASVIVVDQSMLEKIEFDGGRHHLILENYVVGIVRGLNEG